MEKIYEQFHKKTYSQKKLINVNNFTYREIIKTINKYLKTGDSLLDIGCGAGTLVFFFANKVKNVTGIDVSKKAINKCIISKKNLKLNNVLFEVKNFPIDISLVKYDFIIISEVIEHIKNDELAIKKIYSLLKPGGYALITTPSKNAPLFKLRLADDFDRRVGHLRRYTADELIKMCKKNGFEIVEIKKTEGIIRNFLFLNDYAGKLIRFIKYFLSDLVTFIDNISLKLFGESNLFIVVRKPL